MKDKKLPELVDRLGRIFPHLKLHVEHHYICDEKGYFTEDFCIPHDLTWYDLIEILKENGLEISNKDRNKIN